MLGFLAFFAGGTFAVWLLSLLFEWAIFKRVLDSPATGIPASVATAVVFAIVIYGFGNADGGPWNPYPGMFAYMLGGAIVLPLRLASYRKRMERGDVSREDGIEDVFR